MNTKWIVTALSLALTMSVAPVALAQKKGSAETSLIGIKLYDTGLRVISVYGTPDTVESVGGGGNAIGPGGGGAPGGGAAGAPGGAGAPSAPGGAGGSAGVAWNDPGDLGNQFLQKAGAGAAPSAPGAGGPPGQGGQGFGPGGGGPPGAGGPGGGSVGGGNSSGRILFTRWIYNRNGSKYGFVLDKSNRVVQIEAIGMSNSKVKTSKGVTFGSTFAQLIKKYNAPDGYEISGDNIVVRFMVRNKVAFRLSRLGPNKPQVVTGIVVAAGKT